MKSNKSKLSIIKPWFWFNLKVIEKLHRSNALEMVVFFKILEVLAFYPYPIGSWTADQRPVISHWIWWLHFDIFEISTNSMFFTLIWISSLYSACPITPRASLAFLYLLPFAQDGPSCRFSAHRALARFGASLLDFSEMAASFALMFQILY